MGQYVGYIIEAGVAEMSILLWIYNKTIRDQIPNAILRVKLEFMRTVYRSLGTRKGASCCHEDI